MSHDRVATTNPELARLAVLAEFRYQLRQFLSFSEGATEAAGIAAQQYQLMQVIEAMPPGGKASITYLAERMVLRHNSTVELVDRAERAGLVRRESDATDMRRSLVELTAKGRAILFPLIQQHLRELDAHGARVMDALQNLLDSGKPALAPPAPTQPNAGMPQSGSAG